MPFVIDDPLRINHLSAPDDELTESTPRAPTVAADAVVPSAFDVRHDAIDVYFLLGVYEHAAQACAADQHTVPIPVLVQHLIGATRSFILTVLVGLRA